MKESFCQLHGMELHDICDTSHARLALSQRQLDLSQLLSCLPQELQSRVSKLAVGTCTKCSVCAAEKPPLVGCKCDATSFFTSCNKEACLGVVAELMQRLAKRGATGVLLHREEKGRDRVHGQKEYDHAKFRLITFDDVRAALEWAARDILIEVAG